MTTFLDAFGKTTFEYLLPEELRTTKFEYLCPYEQKNPDRSVPAPPQKHVVKGGRPRPEDSKPRISVIGIYAPTSQSGKSLFASQLKEALEDRGLKVACISFADPLRALGRRCLEAFGYVDHQTTYLLTEWKDRLYTSTPSTNGATFSGRDILVALGDGGRDILGEHIWVDAFKREAFKAEQSGADVILVDDMRRENEYEHIKGFWCGKTIAIHRPHTAPTQRANSPKGIEGCLNGKAFDCVINNSGTVENLKGLAEQVAKDWYGSKATDH